MHIRETFSNIALEQVKCQTHCPQSNLVYQANFNFEKDITFWSFDLQNTPQKTNVTSDTLLIWSVYYLMQNDVLSCFTYYYNLYHMCVFYVKDVVIFHYYSSKMFGCRCTLRCFKLKLQYHNLNRNLYKYIFGSALTMCSL